jgi:nuclear GTP-binding protein
VVTSLWIPVANIYTQVISQENLKAFREAMAEKANDPYQVLLKTNRQLPMTLLKEPKDVNGLKVHKAKMTVESTPFPEVFGAKAQRKRVKIGAGSFTDLVDVAEKSLDTYQDRQEQAELVKGDDGDGPAVAKEPIFNKGGSKRIW